MEERGMNARIKALRKLSLDTPAHIDLERALSETATYKKYEGELFMIYLAGYGLGRFFFEWFRTDKLYIPGTKVGISLVISAILFAVFMPVVIIRRVMAQKRDTIRRQRKKRFLDESVKEKQMFPETSEMKPEPEIRPEMDEQVKPDVGTSPTNSKEEQ